MLPSTFSCVVLAYNSAAYLAACLQSIAASTQLPAQLLVVDNASSDESVEVAGRELASLLAALPPQSTPFDWRVLPLPQNLGCAGGNNAGWRATTHPVCVLLNPDTEVTPTFFAELLAPFGADSAAGIVGAKIYYPGTTLLQHAGGRVHPNGMTTHDGAGRPDVGEWNTPRDCDYVTGAGVALRLEMLRDLQGFDEDFFPAYFEECELCTRALRAGWRCLYQPTAVLYHHESVTLTVDSPGFRRLYQRMRIRYLLKTGGGPFGWRRALGFEKWWMLHEPAARGYRREQLRAWAEGALWLARRWGAARPKPCPPRRAE